MKQLMLLTAIALLAACTVDDSMQAKQDCKNMHYTPGTPDYEHCKVDMKAANKMQDQNKAAMPSMR